MPLWKAQLQIWQNLFSLATQPAAPLGHVPLCILGHFSQAIPQTPISTLNHKNNSIIGYLYSFSNMLMAAENANSHLPPIGFCNEPLLGSEGCALFCFFAVFCFLLLLLKLLTRKVKHQKEYKTELCTLLGS
jgi:hypothetical protein